MSYELLTRIADGLGVARGLMGLAYGPAATDHARDVGDQAADLTVPQAAVAPPPAGTPGTAAESVVTTWTGVETRALRVASRLSVREFGRRLGISDRSVSKWEAGGAAVRPRPFTQAVLDTALSLADDDTKVRFRALLAAPASEVSKEVDDNEVGGPEG